MEQCKYVYVQGENQGYQCDGKAIVNGFCNSCKLKKNAKLQLEQGYIKPWKKPEEKIRLEVPSLDGCKTLAELCRSISNLQDFYNSTQDLCKEIDNDDISYDITATVKYLAQLESEKDSNREYKIFVFDRKRVECCCNGCWTPLSYISWHAIAQSKVAIYPEVSIDEAVRVIVWILTKTGWPDDYYKWLEVDKNNNTIEEFNNVVRQKLLLQ